MMRKGIFSIIIGLWTLGMTAFVQHAVAEFYKVKIGDTLSSIITEKKLGGPIFGPQGSLRKMLAVNPQIKNANRIFPGDLVEIDFNAPVSPPTEANEVLTFPINSSDKIENDMD